MNDENSRMASTHFDAKRAAFVSSGIGYETVEIVSVAPTLRRSTSSRVNNVDSCVLSAYTVRYVGCNYSV